MARRWLTSAERWSPKARTPSCNERSPSTRSNVVKRPFAFLNSLPWVSLSVAICFRDPPQASRVHCTEFQISETDVTVRHWAAKPGARVGGADQGRHSRECEFEPGRRGCETRTPLPPRAAAGNWRRRRRPATVAVVHSGCETLRCAAKVRQDQKKSESLELAQHPRALSSVSPAAACPELELEHQRGAAG